MPTFNNCDDSPRWSGTKKPSQEAKGSKNVLEELIGHPNTTRRGDGSTGMCPHQGPCSIGRNPDHRLPSSGCFEHLEQDITGYAG